MDDFKDKNTVHVMLNVDANFSRFLREDQPPQTNDELKEILELEMILKENGLHFMPND